MANRDVTVRLSAEISGYIGPMQQAEQATSRAADSADRLDQSARSAGQSASAASQGTRDLGRASQEAATGTQGAATGLEGVASAASGVGAQSQAATRGMLGVSQAAQDGARQAAHFDSAMAQAGTSIGSAVNYSSGFSGAMLTIGQGMMDAAGSARAMGEEITSSARTASSDWNQVGASLGIVAGGFTALGASLMTTGIRYNTLQQVAGRAMETMAGSTELAAEQMERLHAFADESPFARDTWIQAQQQLMAFGMEAERVVPTLEGVQNAVAAIGGGDQEIMQLVDILGQVEGQGRITGRELQRLGQMGINAADLIGDAMGVSGNEIREQITAGALDAETAITALTTGMMNRFDGAAEGLRDTMEGALDRIRARVRDIGSILAEPLVNPEGGGYLVEAINQTADFLALVRDLPDPVLQTGGAIAGLGAAGMTGLAGMMLLVPQVVNFRDSMKRLQEDMPRTSRLMGGLGRAAGIAAVAFTGLAIIDQVYNHFRDGARSTARLEAEMRSLASTGSSLDAVFHDINVATGELLVIPTHSRNIEDLGDAMDYLGTEVGMFSTLMPGWLSPISRGFEDVSEEIESMDGALAGMVSGGNGAEAAEFMSELAESALEAGYSAEEVAEMFPQLTDAILSYMNSVGIDVDPNQMWQMLLSGELPDALREAESAAADTGSAFEGATGPSAQMRDAFGEVADAAREASDHISNVIDDLTTLGVINLDAEAKVDQFADTTRDFNDVLEAEAERVRDLEQALADGEITQAEYNEQIDNSLVSLDNSTEAGSRYRDMLRDAVLDVFELGEGIARMGGSTEDVSDAMQSGIDDIVAWRMAAGESKEEAEEWVRTMLKIPDDISIETYMDDQAQIIAEETEQAIDNIPDYKEVELRAIEDGAREVIEAFLAEDYETFVDMIGNDEDAQEVIASLVNGDWETVAHILGDDEDARGVIQAFLEAEYGTTAFIYGDSSDAIRQMDLFTGGSYSTTAQIYGDDGPARDTMWGFTETGWGTTVTADAQTAAAERALNWAARNRTSTITQTIQRSDLLRNSSTDGPYRALGGRANAGAFAGHMGGLPSFSIGGRLPSTGLGTDSILGLSRSGTPTAWVDDREWIINRTSSDKYDGLLRMINADHPAIRGLSGFASGGRPREFAASAAPPPVAAMVGASGGDQRPVNFNFHTVNPIAEPQSRTAQRSMEAIGMGWAPDEMGGPHG